MKAVFLDTDWLGPEVSLEGIKQLPVDWIFYPETLASEMMERTKDAQIVVGKYPYFTRESFAKLPHLKLVCVAATGVDCVDLPAAREAGIAVCNVPGYSTTCVAQHAMLLMLALSVNHFTEEKKVATSKQFQSYPIRELQGKTLGIVGYGNIGREVARLATAFGMKVLISHRSTGVSLEELLRTSDYVSLHVPLTTSTRNMISKREFSWMKPSAYLINTARGALIQEQDLAEALKEGKIAGAALDVLSEEPPSPHHPLLDPNVPRLILTPHIAWASKEARIRLIKIVEENIRAFLEGTRLNIL